MNVHLIRTWDVRSNYFTQIFEILTGISGPITFKVDPFDTRLEINDAEDLPFSEKRLNEKSILPHYNFSEDSYVSKSLSIPYWPPKFPERVTLTTWDSLFEKCNDFRKENSIPEEDHVVILTDLANNLNWFSGTDALRLNHFVHSDQWDFFLPSDPRFPVAYEVAACIMRRLMFNNYEEGKNHFHQPPKGCINDFCEDKREVTLKLRTGDICPACMEVIITKNIHQPYVDQVLRTFDAIRIQMLFRERYRNLQRPSRLFIKGASRKIYFTDLADAELKLTPLERTLYLLFLKEENGLLLNELCDHRDWIKDTYKLVGNPKTIAEMENSINQLIDPTENSANEKISKIRKKLEDLLGEDMAKQYVIEGPKGKKRKIVIDRSLVSYG